MLTEISFCVESTDYSIPLGFQARLDGTVCFDSDHLKEPTVVRLSIDDNTESAHVLEFVLKNKSAEHTKISNTGEIISDALININNILFDSTPIDEIAFNQAQYTHDFNGTGPVVEEQFFGAMGCNGTVKIEFNTPMYLWMLENM